MCEKIKENSTTNGFVVQKISNFQGNGASNIAFPADKCVVEAIAEDPRFSKKPVININKSHCALCKKGVLATLVKKVI